MGTLNNKSLKQLVEEDSNILALISELEDSINQFMEDGYSYEASLEMAKMEWDI